MILNNNLNVLLSARKDLSIAPSTKMKQLQWDKLAQQQAAKTVFSEEETAKEEEWLKKLQLDGVWVEMEEDFKAKQLVINIMGKDRILSMCHIPNRATARQKQAELKSVLDPQTRKLVGTILEIHLVTIR
jgi:cytokinesis protein